jgi:hypothetical protein
MKRLITFLASLQIISSLNGMENYRVDAPNEPSTGKWKLRSLNFNKINICHSKENFLSKPQIQRPNSAFVFKGSNWNNEENNAEFDRRLYEKEFLNLINRKIDQERCKENRHKKSKNGEYYAPFKNGQSLPCLAVKKDEPNTVKEYNNAKGVYVREYEDEIDGVNTLMTVIWPASPSNCPDKAKEKKLAVTSVASENSRQFRQNYRLSARAYLPTASDTRSAQKTLRNAYEGEACFQVNRKYYWGKLQKKGLFALLVYHAEISEKIIRKINVTTTGVPKKVVHRINGIIGGKIRRIKMATKKIIHGIAGSYRKTVPRIMKTKGTTFVAHLRNPQPVYVKIDSANNIQQAKANAIKVRMNYQNEIESITPIIDRRQFPVPVQKSVMDVFQEKTGIKMDGAMCYPFHKIKSFKKTADIDDTAFFYPRYNGKRRNKTFNKVQYRNNCIKLILKHTNYVRGKGEADSMDDSITYTFPLTIRHRSLVKKGKDEVEIFEARKIAIRVHDDETYVYPIYERNTSAMETDDDMFPGLMSPEGVDIYTLPLQENYLK